MQQIDLADHVIARIGHVEHRAGAVQHERLRAVKTSLIQPHGPLGTEPRAAVVGAGEQTYGPVRGDLLDLVADGVGNIEIPGAIDGNARRRPGESERAGPTQGG